MVVQPGTKRAQQQKKGKKEKRKKGNKEDKAKQKEIEELRVVFEQLSKDDPNGLNVLRGFYETCKKHEKNSKKARKDDMIFFKMTIAEFMLRIYPAQLKPSELREFLFLKPHNEGVSEENIKEILMIQIFTALEYSKGSRDGLRNPIIIRQMKKIKKEFGKIL